MKSILEPNRFTVYKKSTSTHDQWGAISGLTFYEAHGDHPFGVQKDPAMNYVWCVCLTECYKGNTK